MGFDGVIITDALDMAAVASDDAAISALAAGADLLCLGSNFDERSTVEVAERIAVAVADGRLNPDVLARSAARVGGLTRTSTRSVSPAPNIARRALDVTGTIPPGPFAVVECRPTSSMASFNVAWGLSTVLGDRDWPLTCVTSADAVPDSTVPTVVVVRDAGVHTWQHDVIARCAHDRSTVVVEMGWPSGRQWDVAASIVTHGAARSSALAVLELLEGK